LYAVTSIASGSVAPRARRESHRHQRDPQSAGATRRTSRSTSRERPGWPRTARADAKLDRGKSNPGSRA